jgi:hypothetical protein
VGPPCRNAPARRTAEDRREGRPGSTPGVRESRTVSPTANRDTDETLVDIYPAAAAPTRRNAPCRTNSVCTSPTGTARSAVLPHRHPHRLPGQPALLNLAQSMNAENPPLRRT